GFYAVILSAGDFSTVILSGMTGRRSRAVMQSKDPVSAGSTAGLARSFYDSPDIPPHNNPVIAENLDILNISPKPRSRALPRPGMTNKQIRLAIRAYDPRPVQL